MNTNLDFIPLDYYLDKLLIHLINCLFFICMSDELIGDNNTTGLDLLKLIYIKPGNVTTLNIAFFGKNI